MLETVYVSLGEGVTEKDKGTPEGGVGEECKCGSAKSMCRRRWWPVRAPSEEGKVRKVRALLRLWLPWLRSRAQCQRWGLAPGPGWGVLTAQKTPQSSSWNHRHQITISPGGEVEEEAQMCARLTSVHGKTSGHLSVFVCVRVCTPVLVCGCRCVSVPAFVSVCTRPLSQCVWLSVYARLHGCVWCVCVCG